MPASVIFQTAHTTYSTHVRYCFVTRCCQLCVLVTNASDDSYCSNCTTLSINDILSYLFSRVLLLSCRSARACCFKVPEVKFITVIWSRVCNSYLYLYGERVR